MQDPLSPRRLHASTSLALAAVILSGCNFGPPNPIHSHESAGTSMFPNAESVGEHTDDWHQWRGPNFTGVTGDTNWTFSWPPAGPSKVWEASVGTGFASMSVRDGRLFTAGNQNDMDTVYCFDAVTGDKLWEHTYSAELEPKYYDGGPSATPAVDGAVVFTLSKAGDVFCLQTEDGAVVWSKNLVKELGVAIPTWGFAGSPAVIDDLVILNVGTHGTALDKKTGKVVWSTGKAAAGYSSAVPFVMDGRQMVAIFSAKEAVGVAVDNGEVAWSFPWKTDYDVNSADPIVVGNKVFISSGYGTGCAVFEFSNTATKQIWRNTSMRNHFNSSVYVEGYVYGVDGQAEDSGAELKCLDFASGEVKWSQRIPGTGTLISAAGELIVLSGKGQLIIAKATPDKYEPRAMAQVIGGKNWTAPALSNGYLYVRNASGKLICLDVRQGQSVSAATQ